MKPIRTAWHAAALVSRAVLVGALLGLLAPGAPAFAQVEATGGEPEGAPSAVVVAGSLQSELGCAGDWDPACAATGLAFDSSDQIWQATFSVPAGGFEYLGALNGGWTETYGQGGVLGGANIPLALGTAAAVKFYYDDTTHWVTDSVNSVIAIVAGNFQSEVACPGDWQPDCLRSWLADLDGDGRYRRTIRDVPPGNYECLVAINESWTESYGLGGVPGGPNIPFLQPYADYQLDFDYDSVTHILTVTVALFADDFESRATGQWSATVP